MTERYGAGLVDMRRALLSARKHVCQPLVLADLYDSSCKCSIGLVLLSGIVKSMKSRQLTNLPPEMWCPASLRHITCTAYAAAFFMADFGHPGE